jgi:hypothetical protein
VLLSVRLRKQQSVSYSWTKNLSSLGNDLAFCVVPTSVLLQGDCMILRDTQETSLHKKAVTATNKTLEQQSVSYSWTKNLEKLDKNWYERVNRYVSPLTLWVRIPLRWDVLNTNLVLFLQHQRKRNTIVNSRTSGKNHTTGYSQVRWEMIWRFV